MVDEDTISVAVGSKSDVRIKKETKVTITHLIERDNVDS